MPINEEERHRIRNPRVLQHLTLSLSIMIGNLLESHQTINAWESREAVQAWALMLENQEKLFYQMWNKILDTTKTDKENVHQENSEEMRLLGRWTADTLKLLLVLPERIQKTLYQKHYRLQEYSEKNYLQLRRDLPRFFHSLHKQVKKDILEALKQESKNENDLAFIALLEKEPSIGQYDALCTANPAPTKTNHLSYLFTSDNPYLEIKKQTNDLNIKANLLKTELNANALIKKFESIRKDAYFNQIVDHKEAFGFYQKLQCIGSDIEDTIKEINYFLKAFEMINKYAEYRMSMLAKPESGMLNDPDDLFKFLEKSEKLNKISEQLINRLCSDTEDTQNAFNQLLLQNDNQHYSQSTLNNLKDSLFKTLPEALENLSNVLKNKGLTSAGIAAKIK